MTALAVFDRYGGRDSEEFATVEAAASMLAQGEEDGELTPVRIEPAGASVIEGRELRDLLGRERVFPRGFLEDW